MNAPRRVPEYLQPLPPAFETVWSREMGFVVRPIVHACACPDPPAGLEEYDIFVCARCHAAFRLERLPITRAWTWRKLGADWYQDL